MKISLQVRLCVWAVSTQNDTIIWEIMVPIRSVDLFRPLDGCMTSIYLQYVEE